MRNDKLFVLMFSLIIISSISVTATIGVKQNIVFENKNTFFNYTPCKMEDKIIDDTINYTSLWIDYDDSITEENIDNSDLCYYYDENFDQATMQLTQSIDLTSLIIQITESTVTNYIQTLVGFGPRVTGTTACTNAGNYIAGFFDDIGLDVRIQQWTSGGYNGFNVEATLPGINEDSNEVYLVCGHYDSVTSSPGADDNAAGTAAAMASALVMSEYTFEHTVKFVAFSGEEQGLLGSSVYASEAKAEGVNIKEVLNADMIGYAETYDDQHNIGVYGSATIASTSQQMSDEYPGLIDLTVNLYSASGNSDHWPFIQQGYDAAMYHEYHFNPYYHSSQDTIDKMDLDYDMRVTRMIMATLAYFSNLIITDDGGGGYVLRPSVNIEDPSTGEYVRGTIDIKGKASTIKDYIKYVMVKIDDNDWEYAKIEETSGNYINWSYSWDTTLVEDDPHLISAISLTNRYIDSPIYPVRVNVINELLTTDIIMPDQADIEEIVSIQSFTIGGLPPYNYTWDLGGGIKKYEQDITYSYNYPGEYKVELVVRDSINNTAYASKTIQIIDDIPPMISILNPKNAFYLNNNEIFNLKNPVIIGDIDILLDVSDNSIIDYVVLYINNLEKHRFSDSPYAWTWDEKMFGEATINVVVFDIAGNQASDTINVWKFF